METFMEKKKYVFFLEIITMNWEYKNTVSLRKKQEQKNCLLILRLFENCISCFNISLSHISYKKKF